MNEQKNMMVEDQKRFVLPQMIGMDGGDDDLADDMEGLQLSFPQIKVPGGGSLVWELPSGDPQNPNYEKYLEGVILFSHNSLPPARRDRHHLARPGRPGGRRRRALGTGRHRKGDGVLLPPRLGRAAAELRQNLLQGERLFAGHTCIPFVVPVLGHGSHLLCMIWMRGRP